jgi:iron complex outermembrane receptor protein
MIGQARLIAAGARAARSILAIVTSVTMMALVMVGMTHSSWAADADGVADSGGLELGEIDELEELMVDARRIRERLQDVPVAITALSVTALSEQRVASESDLQMAVPGLTVRQTTSSNNLNFAIRGQSIDSYSYSAPAVTAYFNEVQAGGASATAFYDLESIQVLKGPQGTLFGRNATGGAVLYSTKRPLEKFEGYLRGGVGNHENFEVEGALNLALTDAFAIRFAGKSQKREGYQTNLADGDKWASIDAKSGRISLLLAPPGSPFEDVLVYQYGRYRGNNASLRIANANGVNGAPSTYFDPLTGTTQPLITNMRDLYGPGGPGAEVALGLGFTDLSDFLTRQSALDFYEVYSDRHASHRARQNFLSNTTNYQLMDDMKVKNIFGYNEVVSGDEIDIDGSPYQFITTGEGPGANNEGVSYGTKQWSEELQLSGKASGDRLTYILGAFFSEEETYNRIPLCVSCDLGFPGFIGRYDFTVTDQSKALFAQGTYALSKRLNLTVGARSTWENVSIEQGADSLLFGVDGKRSDTKPSWLVGLDYRLNDDLMIYFNQRGSWRTGGFNGTSGNSAPQADTFKPETTYDFEIGAKFAGVVGAKPARLYLALYNQIVSDAQRAPYIGISAVAGNVEKAEVKGAEIEGSLNLTGWLDMGGSYSYTDAEFTKNRATVAGGSFAFGPYGDAPQNQRSAYFRIKRQLVGGGGNLALRGSVYSQSSFFYSNLANTIMPGTRIDGYTLLNARLEWNDIMASKLSAAAYVQNISDEEYAVGGFALSSVTGSNAILPGTPRMFGVEFDMKF